MPSTLTYLAFEDMGADGDCHTWEAMASVAPPQLPLVLAEAQRVLDWAHAHLGVGPAPLDEGGDWDMLLQLQADEANAVPLAWAEHHQALTWPALPRHTAWAAVTMTLVVASDRAEALEEAAARWSTV